MICWRCHSNSVNTGSRLPICTSRQEKDGTWSELTWFNMAARANNMLWLAEISKIFFSETNELTEPKLSMKDHWNVHYQVSVFCSDMKFKMAATTGLSLTLEPMGKMFQNASSLKPLGQLKPNCPGMIIGRSSTNFCFLCRSEIQDGHHRRT